MEVFEAYEGMYNCRLLPGFARFLLEKHHEEFAKAQIELGWEVNVPLLTVLAARYSEEQLIKIAIESTGEYLQFLSGNQAKEQLVGSMNKWVKDQLSIVGKLEVSARDITVINYTRAQTLKEFIPAYTSSIEDIVTLHREIDTLVLGANTTAVDIYIGLLKSQVAEQSNLASKVIEASPAVTFLFDTKTHQQIFISGNVTEVLGYSAEEIMLMGDRFLLDLTHPHDVQGLLGHLREVIAENSNRTTHYEFRFRHKDGSYRWIRIYEVIFNRDAQGNPLELLGKIFEITQEKEMALALEKREKQLLEAQRIAHIGSYEWMIDDNKSVSTDEVYRIFELDKDQPYEEFLQHVHPDDVQKVTAALEKSYETGYYDCEFRYSKNNKEKVIWSIGRVEFIDKRPYRMLGTVQDITEIKKMERALVQKSEQLAQTNESLRQFAYVASHDMKEPLRKIMMFADLVLSAEKGKLSDKSVNQLQKMQISGRNLYKMVEDILSFSLLEAREQRKRVKLNDIISEVCELLEETIRAKQAKLNIENLPEADVIPSQFRQLFQNLISNSLKFTRNGTTPVIHITGKITRTPIIPLADKAPAYLEMCLEDNGMGFPEEASERIFELFNRYHSKRDFEGTGLGLSISRRIVDNHQGVIKAVPGNKSGAIFRIVIPQPSQA